MKVAIRDGNSFVEYETSWDWTAREELVIRETFGMLPGELITASMQESTLWVVALAIVAWRRNKPGVPHDVLLDMRPTNLDGRKVPDEVKEYDIYIIGDEPSDASPPDGGGK